MRKQEIAIIALALWLIFIFSVFTLLVQRIDFSLLFVLGFIGLLVIVQLIEPNYVQPSYMQYIRTVAAVGMVIILVIVVQKVMLFLAVL